MWTDEKALALALVDMAESMATHDSTFLIIWRSYAGWEEVTEEQALAACAFMDRLLRDDREAQH